MKKQPNKKQMRLELNTDDDMAKVDIAPETPCAVCGKPIEKPALWIAAESMDFFLHKNCESKFTPEIIKKSLGDIVLIIQDESFHDVPPERN
jgi:hypothetical protein